MPLFMTQCSNFGKIYARKLCINKHAQKLINVPHFRAPALWSPPPLCLIVDQKTWSFRRVDPRGKIMPAQAANRKSMPSVLVVYILKKCSENLGMGEFFARSWCALAIAILSRLRQAVPMAAI
ncbi:hypothetical protein [Rhizobium sp. H4]|uniref:hypothetical protein n=1 Tax=Rhizobium sp. H4 TaxID=2035449 RepID=UPI001143CD7C|nr:hypothetical protein [Rhizobium sp. H4]